MSTNKEIKTIEKSPCYDNWLYAIPYKETEMDDEIITEQIGYRTIEMMVEDMQDAGLNLTAQRMGVSREELDNDDDIIYTPIYEIDPSDATERLRQHYLRLNEKFETFKAKELEKSKSNGEKATTETVLEKAKTDPIDTTTN